jgi:hypothetical protein
MGPKGDEPKGRPEPEIVVFWVRRDTKCAECGTELWKGSLLRLEGEKALCVVCADLDHLELLPSGDAAVTRRASKYSKLRAVVVRWAPARKRYERQGILVEPEALARAEEESLADAELRERRRERAAERRALEDQEFVEKFAGAIRQQYPRCPAREALQIAEHACRKYSGRVGRSAAAKEFSPDAVRLAVIAHIRHVHTDYDELLLRYADRMTAREQIWDQVSEILKDWERAGPSRQKNN